MIENERQYRVTKAQLERLETARAHTSVKSDRLAPKLHQAMRAGLESQIADLRAELEEYAALRGQQLKELELSSLADLPELLIKARIAHNLTQAGLARRLRLKEQQIQRYEATRYRSASFARLLDVARVLGIDLKECVRIRVADDS